ncbi:MAG: SWIM zinc finger family protein [Acidimicrobiales bacterium]
MARHFGSSWWGKAWLRSLETSRFADAGRLSRGRTYARQDRVQDVIVSPGSVSALVWGTETYRTSLGVKILTDDQWEMLIELIVAKARYSAELLSGAMPHGLALHAEEAGAPLLPIPGDLRPNCSCPDWGDPCKHAAALCYSTCDLIDEDPFVLFFVRGRDRATIVEEVRRRRALIAGHDLDAELAPVDDTVDPPTEFGRTVRPLPSGRPLPASTGSVNPLRVPAPADSGLDTRALERLATDAAQRALALLGGDGTAGLGGTVEADLMRRAANRLQRNLSLSRLSGFFEGSEVELEAGARAWTVGGHDGVGVATESWAASSGQLAPAKVVLGPKARKNANALQAGSVQLRLDRLGRWWRFEQDDRLGWVLAAGPFNLAAEAAG